MLSRLGLYRDRVRNLRKARESIRAATVMERVPLADYELSSAVSVFTSRTSSSFPTIFTIALAFCDGHFAYPAQSINLAATSSKLIGFAGLPLPKSARPVIVRPSCSRIVRIVVILLYPAASASG